MVHLDKAEESDLMGLTGVGATSATRILNFLKAHKSFTKLSQLVGCAPQLDVAQFQLQHQIGTWESEIMEFKANKGEPYNTGQPQDMDEPGNKEETSSANGDQNQEDGKSLERSSGDTDLKSMLACFMQRVETLNATNARRLESLEQIMPGNRLDTIEASIQHLADDLQQLRREMRTTAVINVQNAKAAPPVMSTQNKLTGKHNTPSNPEAGETTGGATGGNTGGAAAKSFMTTDRGKTKFTENRGSLFPNTQKKIWGEKGITSECSGARQKNPRQQHWDTSGMENEDEDNFEDYDDDDRVTHQQQRFHNRTPDRTNVPDTGHAKLVDKFEGRVGEWENWFHKTQVMRLPKN
jgi:hypothetical protein